MVWFTYEMEEHESCYVTTVDLMASLYPVGSCPIGLSPQLSERPDCCKTESKKGLSDGTIDLKNATTHLGQAKV